MTPFEAIRKSSTPQIVAEQIVRRIESGQLATGQRLPAQRELAEQLSVGRSSVREAINALVVMGYLEVRHGSGTYVRSDAPATDPSLQHLAAAFEAVGLLDLMEAREAIECQSALLAAQRADPVSVKCLLQHLDKIEATHSEYGIFLQADVEFHLLLAEATGNPVMVELTKLVLDKLTRHHQRLQTDRLTPAYRRQSIETTREIIHAVKQGRGSDAARWMKQHLGAIRSELQGIL